MSMLMAFSMGEAQAHAHCERSWTQDGGLTPMARGRLAAAKKDFGIGIGAARGGAVISGFASRVRTYPARAPLPGC
jgi:hypothetical protein